MSNELETGFGDEFLPTALNVSRYMEHSFLYQQEWTRSDYFRLDTAAPGYTRNMQAFKLSASQVSYSKLVILREAEKIHCITLGKTMTREMPPPL